jgi:hypothetical protein
MMEAVSAYDFVSNMELDGHSCTFMVKQHPESSLRYNCVVYWDDGGSTSITMISTPVGKWIMSGENLPDWLDNHANTLAKEFKAQSARQHIGS